MADSIKRSCPICGQDFKPKCSQVTCSPECRREHNRRRHQGYNADPERKRKQREAYRARVSRDPEYHARLYAAATADPSQAEKKRESERAYYQAHREEILARQKEKRNARTEAEIVAARDRVRAYTREYQRRTRGVIHKTPIPCEICGTMFLREHSAKKVCSNPCRAAKDAITKAKNAAKERARYAARKHDAKN